MWSPVGMHPPICLSGCAPEGEQSHFEPVPQEGGVYEVAPRDLSREREQNLVIQWLQEELEYRFSALDAKVELVCAQLATFALADHFHHGNGQKDAERLAVSARLSTASVRWSDDGACDAPTRVKSGSVRWSDEAPPVPAQLSTARGGLRASTEQHQDVHTTVLPVTEENMRLLQEHFASQEPLNRRYSSTEDLVVVDREAKITASSGAVTDPHPDDVDATSSNQADDGDGTPTNEQGGRRVDRENSVRTGKTSARNRRKIGTKAVQAWKFLEDPDSSPAALNYARFHTCFVMAGVCLLLLQTLSDSPVSGEGAAFLDLGFDFFLLFELVVRFCVCPMKHTRFFRDGFNILDLISTILPLSLRGQNGWIIMDAQESLASGNVPVMIMFCVVPVLRLLKLLRRFQKYQLLTHAFWLILEVLPVLLFTFLVIAMIFSSAIYIVEPRSNIKTMWHAVWFTVVTMTTVGYGDSTPTTTLGAFFAGCLMILSALYMAMPIGIVGHAFNQVWCDRDRILLMKRTRYKIQEWGYNATDIPALFRQFDVDCSGELDIEEFRQMITEMSIGLSDQRIVELFESIDADGGGSIDDKEFIRCLFPGLFQQLCAEEQAQHDEDNGGAPPKTKERFSVGRVLERGWSSGAALPAGIGRRITWGGGSTSLGV